MKSLLCARDSPVGHELCAAQDQMLLLGRKTAIEKVASFLLQLANEVHKLTAVRRRSDPHDTFGYRRLPWADDRDGQPDVHQS